MSNAVEYRVFGSPGTGKTTYLTQQIQAAAEKHGANRIFVASFTKTAATEVAGRNKNVDNVGTLHAHGYRALGGQRKVAENELKSWNEEYEHYRLTGGKQQDLDEVQEQVGAGAGATTGDELYNEMQMNRALLIPRELWRTPVLGFADKWQRWKKKHGIIDYTDMIEMPLQTIDAPPGHPTIGFFDEAQDFTPLELKLIRKWGEALEYIVLAGDDDQCIFEWAGARPEVLIDGEPAKKIVLQQSYRVPRAVHELAQKTILQVRKREPKIYKPRDAAGEVRHMLGANFRMPQRLIKDIEQQIGADRTCMVLASCSYMLNDTLRALKAEGIPYYNQYRAKNGIWNPLKRSTSRSVGTVDRVINYTEQVPTRYTPPGEDFEPIIDAGAFLSWYDILKVGGNIPKGEKSKLAEQLKRLAATDGYIELRRVFEYFERASGIWDFWGAPSKRDQALEWLFKNAISAKRKPLEFPIEIIKRRGIETLKERPKVTVGTIHSVKGGEADVVYVFPDLSYAAYVQAMSSTDAKDAMTRLKYVAYTRAKESLVLLGNATNMTM